MKRTNDGSLRSAAVNRARTPVVVLAGPGKRFPSVGAAAVREVSGYDCGPSLGDNRDCETLASSCGDGEGHVGETACPSQLPGDGCSDLLHELSNLMTGVLLNAQMLEWKLPPYSHLKRPVREVARSAQRSSELMKRLLSRCGNSLRGRTTRVFFSECGRAFPAAGRF